MPRFTEQEATNDPQLHVRTAQAQGPLEHEYQPLRHRKNDLPEYYNVKHIFDKKKQIGDVYEDIELVRNVDLFIVPATSSTVDVIM